MIVELVDARKKYGSLAALDGCDLKIESGELVAVLGLNGAGKTTMLKTMAGVSPLSSGHLIWDGRPCRREDLERRRRILFIPDTPFLVLERSVLENLALFLDAYEIERDAIFIAELLESFDLLEAATSPVSQLSRGQVYKTGLATLFAVEAEVGLLDEPFASGMDAAGIQNFKARTWAAIAEKSSMVYTTQLVDLGLQFATRIVVLNHGKVHADLTPDALRERAAEKNDTVLAKLIS